MQLNKTIRILNIPIKRNKPLNQSLKIIKGLGDYRIKLILKRALLNKNNELGKLKNKEILRLIGRINYFRLREKWRLGVKLDRSIGKSIRLLMNTKSYRGLRHQFRLPVRGQRTRSNRKTIKRRKKLYIK